MHQSIVALGDEWFPENLGFRLKEEAQRRLLGMIDMLLWS